MLPKKYRLSKNKEFDFVFKNGKSSYGKLLGVKIAKNNLLLSRFGILVGSKVDKRAVVRNKIKRRLRAIIYENLNKIKKGYDCVIITLPLIKEVSYQEIKRDLENNFRKLRFYQKKKNNKKEKTGLI